MGRGASQAPRPEVERKKGEGSRRARPLRPAEAGTVDHANIAVKPCSLLQFHLEPESIFEDR